MICKARIQPMEVRADMPRHSAIFARRQMGARACYNRKLLHNPLDIFLEESKRKPLARRSALLAPDYLRHSNEFLPSRQPRYRNFRIHLQRSVAAAEKCASTDVLGRALFLERTSVQAGSPNVEHDSKGNPHFASPLGVSGFQQLFQAVSQRFKVDRFLE